MHLALWGAAWSRTGVCLGCPQHYAPGVSADRGAVPRAPCARGFGAASLGVALRRDAAAQRAVRCRTLGVSAELERSSAASAPLDGCSRPRPLGSRCDSTTAYWLVHLPLDVKHQTLSQFRCRALYIFFTVLHCRTRCVACALPAYAPGWLRAMWAVKQLRARPQLGRPGW